MADQMRQRGPGHNIGLQRTSACGLAAEAGSFAARVIILAFMVGVSSCAMAQVIAIEDQSIGINGKTLVLPAPERAVLDALGGPVETDPPVGDQFSDWVYRWPSFGIEAYSNQRSRNVHALVLLVAPQGYWHGNLFAGELWLGGTPVCPGASAESLAKLGFADNKGDLSVRRGCFYLDIHRSYDDSVESVEIGTRAEWPLVPFPGYPHGQPDPCVSRQ
jgi:hypothetical protein